VELFGLFVVNTHGDNCLKTCCAMFNLIIRWPWQPNDAVGWMWRC